MNDVLIAPSGEETPPRVGQLIESANRMVQNAFGMDADMSTASTSLLDQLLRGSVATKARDARRTDIDAIGCFFGEIARRHLSGRWVIDGDCPSNWRIELGPCFLHFKPVGMTGECVAACESPEYDGAFGTLTETHVELETRLSEAPPLSENEYFTLGGRLEVLSLVVDWLVAKRLTAGEKRPYTAEDYLAVFRAVENPAH